jgi:hypothetical protein
MKKVIKEILDEHEVPEGVKERLMESAKMQLLFKDLGDLFGRNVPKSSADVVETILPGKKNKPKS